MGKAQEFDILSRDGIVKYMRISFRNKAIFTDPYDILQGQLEAINDYLSVENESAPEGVNKAYFTGLTYHWHDTNGSIFQTAYGAAGISLAASAAIILFSSPLIGFDNFFNGYDFFHSNVRDGDACWSWLDPWVFRVDLLFHSDWSFCRFCHSL